MQEINIDDSRCCLHEYAISNLLANNRPPNENVSTLAAYRSVFHVPVLI